MDTNKNKLEKTSENTENTEERRLTTKDELTEFLLYTAPDGQVKVECILHDETIWLTQKRIAELFDVGVPAISKHLKNIFESGELQEEVVISILETTTQHGAMEGKFQAQKTRLYNLDVIISVGYRVNSSKATQFRIWATRNGGQALHERFFVRGRKSLKNYIRDRGMALVAHLVRWMDQTLFCRPCLFY